MGCGGELGYIWQDMGLLGKGGGAKDGWQGGQGFLTSALAMAVPCCVGKSLHRWYLSAVTCKVSFWSGCCSTVQWHAKRPGHLQKARGNNI